MYYEYAPLECNADPEARTDLGETPLHVAASHGHAEVMKLLIDFKADIHTQNDHGEIPLYRAVLHDRVAQGAWKIKSGIKYTQMDSTKQAVELLLDAGASSDVHTHWKSGESVWHLLNDQIFRMGLRKPRESDQSVIDLDQRLRECADPHSVPGLESS